MSWKKQQGFTLIEVLVALILTGVTVAAIVSFVSNSSSTSADEAAVAAQNSKLRSTMALVQRELGDADELIDVDISKKSATTTAGNNVIFSRVQETGTGEKRFTVERISYNGPLDNTFTGDASSQTPLLVGDAASAPAYANTITVQIKTYASNSTVNNPIPNRVQAAQDIKQVAPKVLINDVPTLGTGKVKPLFQYSKSASSPILEKSASQPDGADLNNTAWYRGVQLVDVNLSRDEDIKVGAKLSDVSKALTNEHFPTATLSTSVYLKNLGQHTQSRNQDVEC